MSLRELIYVAKWPSRFRFCTGHFLRAAENIFTQQSIMDVLYDHTSFGLKFCVPVGFCWSRSKQKLAAVAHALQVG